MSEKLLAVISSMEKYADTLTNNDPINYHTFYFFYDSSHITIEPYKIGNLFYFVRIMSGEI